MKTTKASKLFILLFIFGLVACNNPGSSVEWTHGAITRFDPGTNHIYLVFSGDEFADGIKQIYTTLQDKRIKASFFFTGDFYRNPEFESGIRKLIDGGHYLGAHSDKHLLYASWENRDSLLVTRSQFVEDLEHNYNEMARFGIKKDDAPYFLPPYEWYNESIADWITDLGLTLINFTPGTYSNQDWSYPAEGIRYFNSDTIFRRILRYEQNDPSGLNGFILLLHIGADPRRPDKFYKKLPALLEELLTRGYEFKRF